MSKENKSALDLACEEINKILDEKDDWSCPLHRHTKETLKEKCKTEIDGCEIEQKINCGKQYFKEQATIPDCWDVVKEILGGLKTFNKVSLIEPSPTGQLLMMSNKVHNLIIELENKLAEAGIEVSNENV